jgi:hypothetical protein
MKKVYFRSCGGLYLIGKVRKNYNIGDTLTLKSFNSKIRIVDKKENELIVIIN